MRYYNNSSFLSPLSNINSNKSIFLLQITFKHQSYHNFSFSIICTKSSISNTQPIFLLPHLQITFKHTITLFLFLFLLFAQNQIYQIYNICSFFLSLLLIKECISNAQYIFKSHPNIQYQIYNIFFHIFKSHPNIYHNPSFLSIKLVQNQMY